MNAQEQSKKDTYVKNGDAIEATKYHDNGVISQTGLLNKEGKPNGDWVSYNRDGVKIAEAKYNNGEKVGTWFFWKDDTLTEVEYANSRVATVHTWNNKDTRVVSND